MFEPGFTTSARPGVRSLVVRVARGPGGGRVGCSLRTGISWGALDGLPCVAVEEKADADAGFVDLRQLWGQVEERFGPSPAGRCR